MIENIETEFGNLAVSYWNKLNLECKKILIFGEILERIDDGLETKRIVKHNGTLYEITQNRGEYTDLRVYNE